jgi:hypothetical protein
MRADLPLSRVFWIGRDNRSRFAVGSVTALLGVNGFEHVAHRPKTCNGNLLMLIGANEMKFKRAVISVCTWVFTVVLAAAAQSIAEERPPQTSPDTSVLEKGIKEKLKSAKSLGRASTPPRQTSPDTTPVDKAIKRKLD